MGDEERSYFYRRAEEEIVRAQGSQDPRVVNFHYRLGHLYLDKVFGVAEAAWTATVPASAP
jgi:hypothetical protein